MNMVIRISLRWLMLCMVCLIMGCGGGVGPEAGPGGSESSLLADDRSGVGSGGTGSYASGPITRFGSIVVNGIHFDPTRAVITHIDAPSKALSVADLKLGMIVEVTGSKVEGEGDARVAQANAVRIVNVMRGPLEAVNGDIATVMGQEVKLMATTHFGEGLEDGLASKMFREIDVYGFHDARAGRFIATRIDLRPISVRPGLQIIQGVVTEIHPAWHAYRIGKQFYYMRSDMQDLQLELGKVTRLIFEYQQDGLTSWSENLVQRVLPLASPSAEHEQAYLDGIVTYSSPDDGRLFSVNGIEVDATGADCTACAQGLQVGDAVRVQGALTSGKVKATAVEAVTPDAVH